MCIQSSKCYDNSCDGDCVKPLRLWKNLLYLCPNLKTAHGNFFVLKLKINGFSDQSVARKYRLINSLPDTGNRCITLAREYDQKINAIIERGEPITIEEMIEAPAIIAHELFEGDMKDRESRR